MTNRTYGLCARPGVASRSSGSRRCPTPTPASTARRVPNDAASARRHPQLPPRPRRRIVVGVVAARPGHQGVGRPTRRRSGRDHRRRRRVPARAQHGRRVQPLPGVHAAARGGGGVVTYFLVRTVRRTPRHADRGRPVARARRRLGNLVDRVFRSPGFLRGAVVDFVHVGSSRPSTSPTPRSRSAPSLGSCGGRERAPRTPGGDEELPYRRRWRASGSTGRWRSSRAGAARGPGRSGAGAYSSTATGRQEPPATGGRGDRAAGRARPGLPRPTHGAVVVRHEDDDVVVVAKPAGLVVHPGAGIPTARS